MTRLGALRKRPILLAAVALGLVVGAAAGALGTVLLGLGTVLLSWMFAQVLFALHHAHQHCGDGAGVAFAGNDRPDFGEFLDFAFTIDMTFQVSDATTCTRAIRRMVTLHALMSFLFNAVILAAAVNLAAALAG